MPIRSAAARTVINAIAAYLPNRLESYRGHRMTRVRLDHQPDLASLPEIERRRGSRRHVDLDGHANPGAQSNDCTLARRRHNRAGDDVAGAQRPRTLGGDEDVAGADRDPDTIAGLDRHQRR